MGGEFFGVVKPLSEEVKSQGGMDFGGRMRELGGTAHERVESIGESIGDLIEKVRSPYFSDYLERLGLTPAGKDAFFIGEKGESKCVPNPESERGARAEEKLKRYGLDGVEYRDAVPDFEPCSEAVVKIDNMGVERLGLSGNFEQARLKLAEQWNESGRDGRTDWTSRDVKTWCEANNLTIHECSDRKTCMFVDGDIHETFRHSGGVSECRHRDEATGVKRLYAIFDN